MNDWRNNLLNEIASIEEEIEQADEHLKGLRANRTRLKKRLYDGKTGEPRGHDSLLVLRSDIRHAITQWIELYDRQHGKGGQLMLSERSKVSTRLIRSIVNRNGDRRFISLQTADRLLQACNMSHLIPDLDVVENGGVRPVVPDPPFTHYTEE